MSDISTISAHSLNNHYKWGFNDNWFNRPISAGWFQVSIGACSRPHRSFREECIEAARLLSKNISKPILVGLSGGIDSQVVCLSLMANGVKFQPVILKMYNYDGMLYNNHDVSGAYQFCNQFNLVPIEESIILNDYYINEMPDLISTYGFTSAEICVQLYLVKKYKDTHAYINGGGDPIILKSTDTDTNRSYLYYELGPTPIQQYMIEQNIEGCLKFFMYTPELIASYFDHPIMHMYNNAKDAITDTASYTYFTFCIKPMMYKNEWPELLLRKKFTGFERIPFMYSVRTVVEKLNDYINPKSKMVTWKYEDILSHLNSNTGEVKTFRSIDDRDFYKSSACLF